MFTQSNTPVRRIDDERTLDMILSPMPGQGFRTVTKKGIRLENTVYFAAELHPMVGKRVLVRIDQQDMGRIYCFDESGENSNTAIVNQYGNNNTTGITQNGWGNKALVNLLGDYNTTGLEQSGSDNQFILNLEGSNNSVTGQQRGSQNSLRLDLIGTLNNQTFSQIGNNLTLELVDNGSSGIPLQIEQRGDGATVRVENY
jgi:hypothetical protein